MPAIRIRRVFRRPHGVRLAIIAGGLLALSSPPRNLWPFALVGVAIFYRQLALRDTWWERFRAGWLTFFVMFLITLFWMRQFSLPGWPVVCAVEALFPAVAAAVTPSRGRLRAPAFVGAMVLCEYARHSVPLGGLPIGGFTHGQVGGWLDGSARVSGELGLFAVVCLLGTGLYGMFRIHWHGRFVAAFCVAVSLMLVALGNGVDVDATNDLRVATVQAGGELALPRERQNSGKVFADHYQVSQTVRPDTQLIVWPENVVRVERPIAESTSGDALASIARSRQTTLVAGIVQVDRTAHTFRNLAVVWDASDGGEPVVSAYDKVHRVPFGEYVPARSLVERLVEIDQVPNDAIEGRESPVLDVAGHKAAVAVSFEGMFTRHVRAGVRSGGELVVVPTNAASYKSKTVTNMQVQALRLRALETGRWAVQAAPTGVSAIVDFDGEVRQRSAIGVPAVLHETVSLSDTVTPYVRWGDWPLCLLSMLALFAAWLPRLVRHSLRTRS